MDQTQFNAMVEITRLYSAAVSAKAALDAVAEPEILGVTTLVRQGYEAARDNYMKARTHFQNTYLTEEQRNTIQLLPAMSL